MHRTTEKVRFQKNSACGPGTAEWTVDWRRMENGRAAIGIDAYLPDGRKLETDQTANLERGAPLEGWKQPREVAKTLGAGLASFIGLGVLADALEATSEALTTLFAFGAVGTPGYIAGRVLSRKNVPLVITMGNSEKYFVLCPEYLAGELMGLYHGSNPDTVYDGAEDGSVVEPTPTDPQTDDAATPA